MAGLGAEIGDIVYLLHFAINYAHVKVFVKYLRSTESLGVGEAEVHVLSWVVTQRSTGAKDRLTYSRVFVKASSQKDAKHIVFPLNLSKLAPVVDFLINLWE